MPQTPGFIAESKFGLRTNTGRFESPLNNAVQRKLYPGARWELTLTLRAMHRREAAAWQAFLLLLEGSVNAFNGYDPDARDPRGPASGTPLVKGGSQTGSTLLIDGCAAGVAGWMLAGDYLKSERRGIRVAPGVNGELKMLTQDAGTNGSGEATLTFKPALRNSPADNAPLTVRNASCAMTLIDDAQSVWQTNMNRVYQPITLSAVETFS